MSEAKEQSVAIDGTELRITNFSLNDEDVVNYFDAEADAGDIRRVIRVGVQALRTAETTRDVEFVERRFEGFEQEVEKELDAVREEIDKTFKNDGATVQNLLDQHVDRVEEKLLNTLGDDGEFLREALNENNEDSPLYTIKQELSELQKEIREVEARKEERLKSTQKGDDFEDEVEERLQQTLTGPVEDVEATGTKTGKKGEAKKGDFLIETGAGHTIALEVKQRGSSMSKDDIGEYLLDTLENREADHAIMLMRSAEAVPTTKMGWFHEFDRERLCIVLAEDEETEPDWRFLRFAYNWARARAAQQRASGADVDATIIDEELNAVEERIEDFESIRNDAETIRNRALDIEETANNIQLKIDGRLRDIQAELGVSDS